MNNVKYTNSFTERKYLATLHDIHFDGISYTVDVTWEKNIRNYLHNLHGLLPINSKYSYLKPEFKLTNDNRIDMATEFRGFNKTDRKPPEIILDGKGRGRHLSAQIISLKRDVWTIEQIMRDIYGTSFKNYNDAYPLNYLKENKTGYKIKKLDYLFLAPTKSIESVNYIKAISNTYHISEFIDCSINFKMLSIQEYISLFYDDIPKILRTENLNNYNHFLIQSTDHKLIKRI